MLKELSGKYVKVMLSIILACTTLFMAVTSFPQSTSAATTTLYANVNGTNNSNCTSSQPCDLWSARNKVRTLNSNMSGDIIVNLQGGNYPLGATFDLTSADSGTNGYKVIYQSDPASGAVSISGGTQITGWSLYDSSLNIWYAPVSSSLRFRQLYVDGVRATRARYPNANVAGYWQSYGSISGSAPYTLSVNPAELANWANLDQVEVVMIDHFDQKRARIASLNGGTISFMSPENSSPVMNFGVEQANTPHYYENAFEFLDAPGEWYLHTPSNYVFYKPRAGEVMNAANVIAPNIEKLVTVTGAHDITIRGITFQYSNWTKPDSKGYLVYQGGLQLDTDGNSFVPGAIQLQNATNISIDHNTIKHTGAHAIVALDDTKNSTFDHNTINDTSGGGIYLNTKSSNSTGNYVTYNTISSGGKAYSDSVGINLYYAPYSVVNHNEIYYYDWAGIHHDTGIFDANTATTSTNIEIGYNYVHDVMQLLDDGAGIYTNGWVPNMNIHDNYIKSIARSVVTGDSFVGGIYLDAGSRGKTIQNNVLENVSVAFNTNHYGGYLVYGNTFQNNYYNVAFGDVVSGDNTVTNNTASISGSAAQAIINNAGTSGSGGGPTPTPTPTPAPGDTTYGFEDQPSGDNQPLTGVHSGIDFGTGKWATHAGNYYGFASKYGVFSADVTSRTFTLPSGKFLKSIKVSGASGGTYSISDGVNTAKTGNIVNLTPTLITTGWTSGGTTITINFSSTWNSVIDDITYGSTPTPSDTTYGFEDQPSGDNQPLTGVHSGIDFGTGKWATHAGNYYGFASKYGVFSADVTSRTFTLPPGKFLKSIKVSGASGGTYSISDGVNTAKTGNIVNLTPTLITTGWTSGGTTITINFSSTWNSVIDDITYS